MPILRALTIELQMWERTGQLHSESTGAALTESEVAAELASVSDEELLLAMQARLLERLSTRVPAHVQAEMALSRPVLHTICG